MQNGGLMPSWFGALNFAFFNLHFDFCNKLLDFRGVAQSGSVLAWGASGRPFESARPDHFYTARTPSGLSLFRCFVTAQDDIGKNALTAKNARSSKKKLES